MIPGFIARCKHLGIAPRRRIAGGALLCRAPALREFLAPAEECLVRVFRHAVASTFECTAQQSMPWGSAYHPAVPGLSQPFRTIQPAFTNARRARRDEPATSCAVNANQSGRLSRGASAPRGHTRTRQESPMSITATSSSPWRRRLPYIKGVCLIFGTIGVSVLIRWNLGSGALYLVSGALFLVGYLFRLLQDQLHQVSARVDELEKKLAAR
jgi:hypothetical protein